MSVLLVGKSIDALTTAVVLASLGQRVVMYTDNLDDVLAQYHFEHELVALHQMYEAKGTIVIRAFESFVQERHDDAKLLWLFVSDRIFDELDIEQLIAILNDQPSQRIPVIFSGIKEVGVFDRLANCLIRDAVYYLPFVFLTDTKAYMSMLNPSLLLIGIKDASARMTGVNGGALPNSLTPILNAAQAVQVADIKTVEFARSGIMAMLATRVSLMNELSRLADRIGVDISTISTIMGQDLRIGASYLTAGTGFAGRTLPSELATLQASFETAEVKSPVISAVSKLNDDQKELIFRKFWCHFDGFIDDRVVMIWGGSYKTGSGRTDNSPIHVLLPLLWSYNIRTRVAAGAAGDELSRLYGEHALLEVCAPDALDGVSALFVLNDIGVPDMQAVIRVLNEASTPVFDNNTWDRRAIHRLTAPYYGIGKHKAAHKNHTKQENTP